MESAISQQGVFFSSGTPENSVDTTAYAPGLLGKEVVLNVGTTAAPVFRKYKYVKAGGSLANYAVVEYSSAANLQNTVVTGTNNASQPTFFAGIVAYQGTTSITSGMFLWICVPMMGSTVFANHNIATNATFSSTGAFWGLSNGSLVTVATSSASNFANVAAVAMNISSINSTNATSATSTQTTCFYLWLPTLG